MANYQIRITPVDTFFFGGEKHSINEKGALEANYFVESQCYPQQTTLLGLIRYFLLIQNPKVFDGKKILDKGEAGKIIGPLSFDYALPDLKFGNIISLSPLYFLKKDEAYFFAPFDYGFDLNDDLQLSKSNKNYNAKDHYYQIASQKLINAKGHLINLENIVSEVAQIGNEKADKGVTRDNKFYKQFSKKLEKDWCFCIDVEISDDSGMSNNEIIFLPFGGEKNYFRLEVSSKEKTNFEIIPDFKRDIPYIFCKSDCFIDPAILSEADFAVNTYVSFRNLQSKVAHTEKYSGLSKTDTSQVIRGSRFNLLQRGSVLYFKKDLAFEMSKREFQKPHCESIGFNQIIIHFKNQ